MSLPGQEARALRLAWEFLLDLSSGKEKRIPSVTRQRARHIAKHYPLAAEDRWGIQTYWRAESVGNVGKALFDHNMASYGVDPVVSNTEWLLNPDVKKFWVKQAHVAMDALE